eukprot:TRINITY_DN81853_c0_g1_i1.p1 TRINITY_DN81853_c0_g1~~TRINITY_DN81853_c0_g1_i1.p1  ORF type:complete len:305 (-),score=15.90 TRINITY_DN81853_c0_g1_i1:207-1079(-)
MLRSWQGLRRQNATGKWHPRVRFKEFCSAEKAPMLPGMMASSAVFCYFVIFSTIVLAITVVVVIVEFHIVAPSLAFIPPPDLELIRDTAVKYVLVFCTRYLVLDRFVRRCLTHRGFVLHWSVFAWELCFAIPFYLVTSITVSFWRFIVLVCIAIRSAVRLDMSVFPAGWEAWDTGYVSFIAALLLAHRHQNPVGEGFLMSFLPNHHAGKKQRKWSEVLQEDDVLAEEGERSPEDQPKQRRSSKWPLAVTLANNPHLALERKQRFQQSVSVEVQADRSVESEEEEINIFQV